MTDCKRKDSFEMKHLLPYFKKYMALSILAPAFKMLEACFDLAVPLIVAGIIDKGIAEKNKEYIISRFLLLILMALLGLLSSFTAQFFAAKAAIGTATGLRHDLIEKIQSLCFSQTDKIGKNTLITRLTSDINLVQNGLNIFLRLFMRSPFIVFGATVLAFTVNSELALIFVGIIVVLFIIVFAIMHVTKPLHKDVQQKLDTVTGITKENLSGVRVIRAFSRQNQQKEKFYNADEQLLSSQLKVGRISALLNPLTYVTVNIAVILVLLLGAEKTDSGEILSGDIVALINYIGQILIELVKLATLITLIARSIASMGRVGQILDTKGNMKYGTVTQAGPSESAVSFKNVSLTYEGAGAPSVSQLTFEVKKGETVGIIGGTGSGKSTLAHLITRFYDATEGEIKIMGEKISSWDKQSLHKRVCIVPQKPLLFYGTIRSNLLWGNNNADDSALWDALEKAQAKSFVLAKEKGLDEKVEQGGANFSGGQKQRLTIARAFLSKADILILDDSSSALDFATDAALRKAIRALDGNITTFIISQRTSSIAHADKILVLDDGCLVGEGTHGELLESCEIYREIHESQFKKEAE